MSNSTINEAALHILGRHGDNTRNSILRAQEQLEKIDSIFKAPDITFIYYVKAISHWAQEGEVEAEAHSENLQTAIKNAGKHHHERNKCDDWQVQWEVMVEMIVDDESIWFSLPADIYRPLLQGGQAETTLQFRSSYHPSRHGC